MVRFRDFLILLSKKILGKDCKIEEDNNDYTKLTTTIKDREFQLYIRYHNFFTNLSGTIKKDRDVIVPDYYWIRYMVKNNIEKIRVVDVYNLSINIISSIYLRELEKCG